MLNPLMILKTGKWLAVGLAIFFYSAHVYKAGQNSVTVKHAKEIAKEVVRIEEVNDSVNRLNDVAVRDSLRDEYSRN